MNRIIVALDLPTMEAARRMAERLSGEVGGFKIGLELLTGVGPSAIEDIATLGKPVFADAKLHDIPTTVERAAAHLAATGARWVTVHVSGGKEMIRAAVSGMNGDGVLGVTMLTSLAKDDLEEIGVTSAVSDQVVRMSRLAAASGAEGVVCSPAEVHSLKKLDLGLSIFTPGIRPDGAGHHDQMRVATPAEAAAAGADYLVIGRPITSAVDPVATAREIAAAIDRVP
jgi:orotidine-5'-phosphate decarboxylase